MPSTSSRQARVFVLKPDRLDHVEAAAIPMVGLTAWQALVDTARECPQRRMRRKHDNGESANTIASTLGVSRATVYRVLAEELHHD